MGLEPAKDVRLHAMNFLLDPGGVTPTPARAVVGLHARPLAEEIGGVQRVGFRGRLEAEATAKIETDDPSLAGAEVGSRSKKQRMITPWTCN